MKYIKSFESLNINKSEIAVKLVPEFGSLDDSKFEVDMYIDLLLEKNKKGGNVYRLVWLKNKSLFNSKNLGYHWIMDKGIFDRFYNTLADDKEDGLYPYLITAYIKPNQIDIESSIETFIQLPHEGEINLKSQPIDFKLTKYRK